MGVTIMPQTVRNLKLTDSREMRKYLRNGANQVIERVKRRGPKPEFPGLPEDAAALDVSRYFLWKVLKGDATSAPLLARYRALKTEQRRVAQ